jgi:hypothetical protein
LRIAAELPLKAASLLVGQRAYHIQAGLFLLPLRTHLSNKLI